MRLNIHRVAFAALLVCGVAACDQPGTEPESLALQDAGAGSRTGVPGQVVTASVTVRAPDGTAVEGVAVQWAVAAGGGSVAAARTHSDVQGQATVAWTLGPQVGEQALQATVAGAAAPLRLAAQVAARPRAVVFAADTVRFMGEGHVVHVPPYLRPGTAPGDTVTWATQHGRIQRVAEGPYAFRAVSQGEDRLIAHFHGDADTVAVLVESPPALVLDVEEGSLAEGLARGESRALNVLVRQASGVVVSGMPVNEGAVWTSSAPGVATVSTTGVVTGHAEGEALIRMEWRGLSDTARVRVHPLVSLGALTPLWSGIVVSAGPVQVDADGTVYFARSGQTGPGGRTPTLAAVSPTGGERWSRQPAGSTAVLPGGGLVVTEGAQVLSLRSDGSERWRLSPCAGTCSLSPAAGTDGTVYLAGDGQLRAVRADGSPAWSVAVPGAATAVVSGTGVVYVTGATSVTGVSSAGARLWETTVGWHAESKVVDAAGTLYLSSLASRNVNEAGRLAAVAPDGTLRWMVQGAWGVLSPGPVGTVLVTDHESVSARGAQDGALRWRTELPRLELRPVAAQTGPDGRVYVPTCYVNVLDGASGAWLGRNEHYFCANRGSAIRDGRLVLLGFGGAASYTLPAGAALHRPRR